jgi:uncharacterized protein
VKYLLLLIVVFVVIWWLRGSMRRRAQAEAPPRPTPGAQPMLTCAHCGVHLPQREAVSGADPASAAVYCSEAHRLAHGDGAPR